MFIDFIKKWLLGRICSLTFNHADTNHVSSLTLNPMLYTKSYVTKDQPNRWRGKVIADHRCDSSPDVVYLFLFIVLCLKLYSSALFAVSSVHSLHISLWFSLQIPQGVSHNCISLSPLCLWPLSTLHSFFTSLQRILTLVVHIWQVFWMRQYNFSSRHSYST